MFVHHCRGSGRKRTPEEQESFEVLFWGVVLGYEVFILAGLLFSWLLP